MYFWQTVYIYKHTDDPTAPKYTTVGTVKAQVISSTPSVAYERWGVETKRPAILHGYIADWETVEVNDRVKIGGRLFAVAAAPKICDVGGVVQSARHAVVLLDELEHV